MHTFSAILRVAAVLAGVSPIGAAGASVVSVDDDFSNGNHDWVAFFLDHPEGVEDAWQMDAGLRPLPQELARAGTGFMLTGNNHSDDLGMALKKRLGPADGIVPGQTYWLDFEIEFASNAPSGAPGVGGSPGDSVYLKAGASATEPSAVLNTDDGHLRPTVNVGLQSAGGPAATIVDVIANGRSADEPARFVALSRSRRHSFPVRVSESGELWLLVMTDSAFEGPTTLHYLRIQTLLTPVETGDGSGLVNLSTRARVYPDDGALIVGFVVYGARPGSYVLRGVGPSLADFGVDDPVANPRLRLLRAGDAFVAENDDWLEFPELDALRAAMTAVGAFPLRENSRDAALVADLDAGVHMAIVQGADAGTGTGLVEIYAVPSGEHEGGLRNLSTRGSTGTDAGPMVAGLVIGGSRPERVLLRAVGPGLTAFGVENTAVDPVLTLYRGDTQLATNQVWQQVNAGGEIEAAAAQAGAFLLEDGSRDAALLVTLPPGGYTLVVAEAQVAPARTVLVEVYSVP